MATIPTSRMRTGIAADVGDDDAAELLGRLHVGLGDDRELARVDSMRPGRNLRVLPAERVLDVLHRQLVARRGACGRG